MRTPDLSGRAAVVTGGLSGIGLASARLLAVAGAAVAVGSRRAGRAAVPAGLGPDALVRPLDVTDQRSVERFLAEARAAHGPAEILVNSAGVTAHAPIAAQTDAAWTRVIETNLTGAMRMMRACLPGMRERGWGRIINIASTAAHLGAEAYGAYCASKAGLLGLSRVAALEGAADGITCVSLSPSWVETEMFTESAESAARRSGRPIAEILSERSSANPQGRLIGPEEIAAHVLFCCSEGAAGLTGEDIRITAGALW